MIAAMCGVAFLLLVLGLSIPATRPQAILAPDGEHPPTVNVCMFVCLMYVYVMGAVGCVGCAAYVELVVYKDFSLKILYWKLALQ